MVDFFIAGSETTRNGTQTIMGHFSTDPESVKRVRDEFKKVVEENDTMFASFNNMRDYLSEACSYDNLQELTYLNMVVSEALRFEPPVPHGTESTLSQDCKIGKYHVKAGDNVQVNITGLHHSPAQWQRPNEFLPERWDKSNKLALTPSGAKRSTLAFSPFLGGKRVCFGKTFAEANLKVLASYMSQYFDMEFVDKEMYPDTHHLPICQLGQSATIPILVKLRLRKD